METDIDINITRVESSKLKDINLENIPFGKYFSDHMLEADYENGEWKNVEIKPYQPLVIEPSLAALHYGQSIFEGIKAYKDANGEGYIFRPYDNFKRFNISAARMCMPTIPEEIFMEGMKQLVALDKNWIPSKEDHTMYIRPLMFATDTLLGVRPSDTYKFLILLSPSGPYYTSPMKIYVEEKYSRSVKGGAGFSKNAGNYATSMIAAKEARAKGYDQVLWTDPFEHKWLQEVGMMNVMFIIDGVAVTPELSEGTILNGVTRNSAIVLLKEMGIEVQERRLSIDEIVEAYKKGQLNEVFGCGTAATIAPIKELGYGDYRMPFDVETFKIAAKLRKEMDDIRYARIPDTHNWMVKI
ncbi:MAG: branched-chain amino acid aminotransferase [Chitinophagaceae bacterium]|nr:branched-chain amino acid aminotransferase [Chitinophagaceae bacterium]